MSRTNVPLRGSNICAAPRVIQRAYRIPSYPPSSTEPVKTFVQRTALHNQIRDQLFRDTDSSPSEVRIVGIWGSGGVGKSQLARSFVQQHSNTYDSTFWIQAGDFASISRDYLHIYNSLPDTLVKKALTPSTDQVRLAVLRAFTENRGRWLMVFDEADSLCETDENFINIRRHYIPSSPNVHIIITSRSALVKDLSTREGVEVGKLHLDEAVELFLRCAKMQGESRAGQEAEARLIVEDLGCLALGVSIAGSYISQTPSLSSNLARYRHEHQLRLDQLLQEQPREMIDMYGRNMMTTWEASFSAVMSRSPHACNIFTILSFFHHEDIFPNLLSEIFSQKQAMPMPFLESWLALDFQANVHVHDIERWLSTLEAYCLIQRDGHGNSYSMHSLLHRWCRARLLTSKDQEPYRFNLLAIYMLIAIDRALPTTDIRSRVRWNPHARECARATNQLQLGSHDEPIARQLRDANVLLHLKARTTSAKLLEKFVEKITYYSLCFPKRAMALSYTAEEAIRLGPFEAVRILELEGTTEIDEYEAPDDTVYALQLAIATARQREQELLVFNYLSQRFRAMFADSLGALNRAHSNRERKKMVKTAENFIQRVDEHLGGGGNPAAVTIPIIWPRDGRCPRLGSKDFSMRCATADDAEKLHSILDPDFCKAWLDFLDGPAVVAPESESESRLRLLFMMAKARLIEARIMNAEIEDRRRQDSRCSLGSAGPNAVQVTPWQHLRQLLVRR